MIKDNFMNIVDALSQYEELDSVVLSIKKSVDPILLRNDADLINFYSQVEFNNFIIEKGAGTLLFIDYDELKEQNSKYIFKSLNPKEYLVFMEKFGGSEPILFNFSESSLPTIYAAYDILEPFKISDSFSQFSDALIATINIVYGKYNVFDIYTNDDCDEYNDEFLSDIYIYLSPILKNNYDNFIKYFWG